MQRLHGMQVVQTTDYSVENPADLTFSDGFAQFAAVLYLVEETIGIELVDYPILFAVLRTEIVGLHLCDPYFYYFCEIRMVEPPSLSKHMLKFFPLMLRNHKIFID